MLFSEFYYCTQ